MRRLAASLAVALAVTFLGVTPGGTEATTPFNRQVSGPFLGTTFFDFLAGSCSFIHQTLDGTYTTVTGASGSFHLDVCPTFDVNRGTVDAGTFSLRDPRGATLAGTVTGVYDTNVPNRIPFTFTLHVATGTRIFSQVHGTIGFTGVWEFVGNPGPISGTLVGSLTPGPP